MHTNFLIKNAHFPKKTNDIVIQYIYLPDKYIKLIVTPLVINTFHETCTIRFSTHIELSIHAKNSVFMEYHNIILSDPFSHSRSPVLFITVTVNNIS